MSDELEHFISDNREAFDDREPNPAILQRIQAQMGEEGKKKGIVLSFRVLRWAAACLVIAAGTAIYWIAQKDGAATTIVSVHKKVPDQAAPAKEGPASETNEPKTVYTVRNKASQGVSIDQELYVRRQSLFAKLNDMGSASSRVTAATEAYRLKGADKEIVDALVHTMNADPNTNVRLAALEALTRFYRETYVKQQLVRSLTKQTDPLVQIQLIQLLTRMKETSILDQLEKMVKDDDTMEAVKDNAYTGIFMLKS